MDYYIIVLHGRRCLHRNDPRTSDSVPPTNNYDKIWWSWIANADARVELNKLKIRYENRNPQPFRKRRRKEEDAIEIKVESNTIDKAESSQEALDEPDLSIPHDDGNLKFFQSFNAKSRERDPKPTKRKPSYKIKSKGQPKISSFFTDNRVKKRFSADSPSPAPT